MFAIARWMTTISIAADLFILKDDGFVIIKRKYPPYGWCLPGGRLEEGETLEGCAVREAKEETGLDVKLICQVHTYSDPKRDPRGHAISTLFLARGEGELNAGDDATDCRILKLDETLELVFDHNRLIDDAKEAARQRKII